MTSQGWGVAQAAPIGLLAVALSTLIGTIEGLFKRLFVIVLQSGLP